MNMLLQIKRSQYIFRELQYKYWNKYTAYFKNVKILLLCIIYYNVLMSIDTINPFVFLLHQNYNVLSSAVGIENVIIKILIYPITAYIVLLLIVTTIFMVIPQEFNFQYRWIKHYFSQMYIHNIIVIITITLSFVYLKQQFIFMIFMIAFQAFIIVFCQKQLCFSEMLQTGLYVNPLMFNNLMYVTCTMACTLIRVYRNHEYFIIPGLTLLIQSFTHGEITGYYTRPMNWMVIYSLPSLVLIYAGMLRFIGTYYMIYQYIGIISITYIAIVQIMLLFVYKWRYSHFQNIRKQLARCTSLQEVEQQFVILDGHLILQDFVRCTILFQGTLNQQLYKRYKLYADVYEHGITAKPAYLAGSSLQCLVSQLLLIHDIMSHVTEDLGVRIVADHYALALLYDNSEQIDFDGSECSKSDKSTTQQSDVAVNLDVNGKPPLNQRKYSALHISEKPLSEISESSIDKSKSHSFNIFSKCFGKNKDEERYLRRTPSLRQRLNNLSFRRQLSVITGTESIINMQEIGKSSLGRESETSERTSQLTDSNSKHYVDIQNKKFDLKTSFNTVQTDENYKKSQLTDSDYHQLDQSKSRSNQLKSPLMTENRKQDGSNVYSSKLRQNKTKEDILIDALHAGSTILPTKLTNQMGRIKSIYSFKSLKSLQSAKLLQSLRSYKSVTQSQFKSIESSTSSQPSDMTQIFVGNVDSNNGEHKIQIKIYDDLKITRFLQQLLYEHTGIWSVKKTLQIDDRVICDLIDPKKLESQPGKQKLMPLSRHETQLINEALKQICQQSERYLQLLYGVEEVSQNQTEASDRQIRQFQDIHHARHSMVASVIRLQRKVPYSLAATWATAYVYGTILLDKSENLHRLTHDLMQLTKNPIDLTEPKSILEQLNGTMLFGNVIIEKMGSKYLVKRPVQTVPQLAVCDVESPLCAYAACGREIGRTDLKIVDFGLLPQQQATKRRARLYYGIEQLLNYFIPVFALILTIGFIIKQTWLYQILYEQDHYAGNLTYKQDQFSENEDNISAIFSILKSSQQQCKEINIKNQNESLFELTDYLNIENQQKQIEKLSNITVFQENITNYQKFKQIYGLYGKNMKQRNFNDKINLKTLKNTLSLINKTKQEITLTELLHNSKEFRIDQAMYRIQKIIELSNQTLSTINCPQLMSYLQAVIQARYKYYNQNIELYSFSNDILVSAGILPNHLYKIYSSCQDILANSYKENNTVALPGINHQFITNFKMTFDYLSEYNTVNQINYHHQIKLIHSIVCFMSIITVIGTMSYGYIRYQYILRKFQFVRYIITKIQYIKFRILDEQKREVHQYIKCLEEGQSSIQNQNDQSNKNQENNNSIQDKTFKISKFFTFDRKNIGQYIIKFLIMIQLLIVLFYTILIISKVEEQIDSQIPSQFYKHILFNGFINNILQTVKYDHFKDILKGQESYIEDLEQIKYNLIDSNLYTLFEKYTQYNQTLSQNFNPLIYFNYLICKIEQLQGVTKWCNNRQQLFILYRFLEYTLTKSQYLQFFNQKFQGSPFLFLQNLYTNQETFNIVLSNFQQIQRPIVITLVMFCIIGATVALYPKYKMNKEITEKKKLLKYYGFIPIYTNLLIIIVLLSIICVLINPNNFKFKYDQIMRSKINEASMIVTNDLNNFIANVHNGTIDQQYVCIFYQNYLNRYKNLDKNKQIIDSQLQNVIYNFTQCQNYTQDEQLLIYEKLQLKYTIAEYEEIYQFITKIEKYLKICSGILIAVSVLAVTFTIFIYIFMTVYNRVILVSQIDISLKDQLQLIFKPITKHYKVVTGVIISIYTIQVAFIIFCLVANQLHSVSEYTKEYQDLYQLRQIQQNIELNLATQNQLKKYKNIAFYSQTIQQHWVQYLSSNQTKNEEILINDYVSLSNYVNIKKNAIQSFNISQSVIVIIQIILVIALYVYLDRFIFFETESYLLQISDLIIQYLENVYNYDMYRDLTQTRALLQKYF